jgi:hypothetical protein
MIAPDALDFIHRPRGQGPDGIVYYSNETEIRRLIPISE